MKNKQYLTFRLHNLQYGIEAALVQELFPLPELTPIIESSVDLIGILNLRGQIVPIIHLDLLQGNSVNSCHLSDYVIAVQSEGLQFGLIAHQVHEVVEINTEALESESFHEFLGNIDTTLISGIAKRDEGNILLLNLKTLVPQSDALFTLIWDAQSQLDSMGTSANSEEQQVEQVIPDEEKELPPSQTLPSFYDFYCSNATPEEREIFRQRADSLKPQTESIKTTNELMSLAVISFGNEFFGLDLGLVREFTDISNLTPIPCCPSHIVGNMNLRGEIVTLVDIRNALNLPTAPVSVGTQAVVIQIDDIVAGLPVDRVLEMASVNAAELTSLPPPLSGVGEQYLRGVVFSEEKVMRVLDLPKLFTEGGFVVNEEV